MLTVLKQASLSTTAKEPIRNDVIASYTNMSISSTPSSYNLGMSSVHLHFGMLCIVRLHLLRNACDVDIFRTN